MTAITPAATTTAAASLRRRRPRRAGARAGSSSGSAAAGAGRRLFSKSRRGQKLTVDRVGLGRRIRSKLLRQEPPAPFVDLERLGPVARGRVCLHQPPVPGLTERLEGDHLVGPLRRLCGVAETKGCVPEHRPCAALEIGQLSALLVDPGAGFARQERLTHQGRGQRCSRPRLLELSGGERCLRRGDRVRRDDHIDPGSFREIEPVAAECAGQRGPAVDACVREGTAQLARDHRQRLVPGRGRCLSPERLGELVLRHRPAPFRNQVREDEATLPAREPSSVEHDTVGFDCDTPCEEDPQLYGSGHPLGLILPRRRRDCAGASRVRALERHSCDLKASFRRAFPALRICMCGLSTVVDRLREAAEAAGADKQDVLDAAVSELGHDARVELGGQVATGRTAESSQVGALILLLN